jgi:hypothetical protein
MFRAAFQPKDSPLTPDLPALAAFCGVFPSTVPLPAAPGGTWSGPARGLRLDRLSVA